MPNKTPQETLEMMAQKYTLAPYPSKKSVTALRNALRALAEDIPEGMVEEVFCAVAIDGYVRRDDARTAIKAAPLWLIGETE